MDKPLPRITPVDRPFWEAANEETLLLQRCASPACRHYFYYPRVCCPYCGEGELTWERASGLGRIVSWTFVHRPQHPSFYDDAPTCFAAVELDEGPMMYAEITPKPPLDSRLFGRSVEVTFVEHAAGQKLPYFCVKP